MDSFALRAWTEHMLGRIADSGCAEVALIVLRDPERGGAEEAPKSPGLLRRLADAPGLEPLARKARWLKRKLLARAGAGLDALLAEPVEPDALERKDASRLLDGIPVLRAAVKAGRFADRYEGAVLEEIRARKLDVLVRLGGRILRGGILQGARFGVWSYHHGDSRVNRGGPVAVWEVLEDQPVTGAVLQILREDLDNGVVLHRGWCATNRYSAAATRNELYWTAASFLPRKLAELHRSGEDAFFEEVERRNRGLFLYSRRLYKAPTAYELGKLLPRFRRRVRERKLEERRCVEQWQLLYRLRKDGPSTSLRRYSRLVPPAGRFWADPFPVSVEGRRYVLFEDCPLGRLAGRISALELGPDGPVGEVRTVLERPYHLSYPCVFRHGGKLCMVPETRANGTVEIYECEEFPDRWRLARTLMKGVRAVDATLYEHGGRWWMFVSMAESPGASAWNELFLFHTDDPLNGEWTPHPRNPIISDVRRARPAGRLFRRDRILYRPSQDCSRRYGYGIRLNEVLALTETEYEEREACFVEPKWADDVLGTHTFNFEGGLSVADALIRVKRP